MTELFWVATCGHNGSVKKRMPEKKKEASKYLSAVSHYKTCKPRLLPPLADKKKGVKIVPAVAEKQAAYNEQGFMQVGN